MSASQSNRLPALSGGLLTNEECFLLLDIDIFSDNDLLKNLPTAAKSGASYYNSQDESSSLYPPSPAEAKPSPAELASDLLELEEPFKQENIFPNWLEEKVDLVPVFEGIPHVERVETIVPVAPVAVPVAVPYAQPEPTEELLREFESVYGAVELTHLTPPQSPPGPASQLLASYAQQAQGAHEWHAQPLHHLPQPDYAAFDAVDELVRQGAAQLPSPRASTASPPSSPRSSTDEEWGSSPRAKPYSRGGDDRRSRKKEQNKNAATRYRQKKKAEVEVLLGEEHALRQRHADLGDKCSDLQREIRYLKGLMRDFYKAKGLIK